MIWLVVGVIVALWWLFGLVDWCGKCLCCKCFSGGCFRICCFYVVFVVGWWLVLVALYVLWLLTDGYEVGYGDCFVVMCFECLVVDFWCYLFLRFVLVWLLLLVVLLVLCGYCVLCCLWVVLY